MPILPKSAYQFQLPRMFKAFQLFPDDHIQSISAAVLTQLNQPEIRRSIPPGSSVAILVGSRGISSQAEIIQTLITFLTQNSVKPFIIPAMGSHGGGIAEEQKKILEDYGISEQTMGVPIVSQMDTVIVEKTIDGVPVHIDKTALSADYVIPVNRIKKHTDFDADIESGLCKMLSVGVGKHNGCTVMHRVGLGNFHYLVPQIAQIVMKHLRVPYGIGIVENAHEHIHTIKAVHGETLMEEEKELLTLSKSLMPYLCFPDLDVLIVETIGKNLCGAGLDPSIMGRTTYGKSDFYRGPDIKRIVLHRLSPGSHGNAIGIGFADFITREMFEAIDFESTYANVVACTNIDTGKIPLILESPDEALRTAICSIQQLDAKDAKVVRIKDTLHLTEIEVSENLLDYCRNDNRFKLI